MSNYYEKYIRRVFTESDIDMYVNTFKKEIEKMLKDIDEFRETSKERVSYIKELEDNKQFNILGSTYREGKKKCILLIIRYPDGTQRDERYSFDKISDMRKKLGELKEHYDCENWDGFREEI